MALLFAATPTLLRSSFKSATVATPSAMFPQIKIGAAERAKNLKTGTKHACIFN